MTYQTGIGVRYPELVSTSSTGCSFGSFVSSDEDLQGGFVPVFWDLPWANLHAVVDIGAVVDWLRFQFKYYRDAKSSLAVLHNQNERVTHFKASIWVSEAEGAVVSKGVTTCAGMPRKSRICSLRRPTGVPRLLRARSCASLWGH